jgi:tripartite-type tricarboxylate transporter receptor subunit TctC
MALRAPGTFLFAVMSISLLASAGHAADYPTKPVQMITPAPAGNGPDVVARLFADRLGKQWGQQVLVVNKPGGSGLIAANAAANAVADGYTLWIGNTSSIVALPLIHKLPFEIDTAFEPIGIVGEQPMVIAVAPKLGVKDLSGLFELAKKQPGQINFAAGPRDSIPRYTMELLLQRAGAKMTYIFYAGGTSQAVSDIMGGRLAVVVESWPALAASVASGAVIPIAVTSPRRLPEHPDVPTAAETFPGFTVSAWIPLLAPAKTPSTAINKISSELLAISKDPDYQKRLGALGTYVLPMSASDMKTFMQTERAKWKPAVEKVQSETK